MRYNAVLFPGQGSQIPHMGKELAQRYPQCMEYWTEAEAYASLPLRSIYWEECSPETMMKTSALQPALSACLLSLLYHYKQHASYSASAGHSLGEFSALHACGVLSSESVLFLTAQRGRLMESADLQGKGSMIALVKLTLDDVQSIVHTITEEYGSVLFIANYNTPAQYILSGEQRVFDRITELATQYKGRAIRFPIAGAFHSPMMQEAQEEFLSYLHNVEWSTPTVPFYSNVTASPLTDATVIKQAMEQQITAPVRFIELIQAMHTHGILQYIELCPKSICAPFVKAIIGNNVQVQTISTLTDTI